MSLEALKAEEAEIRRRTDAAHAVLTGCWAELREVKAKIRAIEHPPRPRKEYGLKPDDDLSFLWQKGRHSWPKDKEERHAEKWRRERIKDAAWRAFHGARDEGRIADWDLNSESYEQFTAREREFYRSTPIAELMRLQKVGW